MRRSPASQWLHCLLVSDARQAILAEARGACLAHDRGWPKHLITRQWRVHHAEKNHHTGNSQIDGSTFKLAVDHPRRCRRPDQAGEDKPAGQHVDQQQSMLQSLRSARVDLFKVEYHSKSGQLQCHQLRQRRDASHRDRRVMPAGSNVKALRRDLDTNEN